MLEILRGQIRLGIFMWITLWAFTLAIYLAGKNPLEASTIIMGDIITPITVLLLMFKYKAIKNAK